MKWIAIFFKSLFSLGSLALIILAMAGLILFASLSHGYGPNPFDLAQDRMALLDTLEDDIRAELGTMQKNEAFTAFSMEYFGGEDEEHAQIARGADAKITGHLDELQAGGQFGPHTAYAAEITQELATFNSTRAAHRQTFDQMVAAYLDGSREKGKALVFQLQEENKLLNASLDRLVQYAENGRLDAMEAFPQDANQAILIAAACKMLLLFLTLLGYLRTSAFTRPLHQLSNAITAIGGDQYSPDLLQDLFKQRGSEGKLARALNKLAQDQQAHHSGLKAEIERLRQALYESRRRRLKLYHEAEREGEQA